MPSHQRLQIRRGDGLQLGGRQIADLGLRQLLQLRCGQGINLRSGQSPQLSAAERVQRSRTEFGHIVIFKGNQLAGSHASQHRCAQTRSLGGGQLL